LPSFNFHSPEKFARSAFEVKAKRKAGTIRKIDIDLEKEIFI